MAFDDALFQLGMDLTRSSTTQTEDLIVRMPPVRDEVRKDPFIERDGVKFAGTHVIVDLVGARRLGDLKHVEDTLKRCVEVAGATLLHVHVHRHTPKGGLSGVAVFAQSHISFHSWPEAGYAAFDVFLCGDAEPDLIIDVLRQAFNAGEVIVNEHRRGEGAVRPKLRPKLQSVATKKLAPQGEQGVARHARIRKVA